MKIGFFDSGVGGISVLKEALKHLPDEDYIYYADTANVPYGVKSKEMVKQHVCDSVDFICRQGIKALVVACNTATSIAVGDLRKNFNFPIIGMEPAVKPAVEKCRDKKVLVAATPLTLKEEKYRNLVSRLDCRHMVDALPLPELVEYAENFIFDHEMIVPYLKKKLIDYDVEEYGTVVLGCTHFIFFKKAFKAIFSEDTSIIDGNAGTVKHLKKILEKNGLSGGTGSGKISFCSSGLTEGDGSRYVRYMEYLDRE